MTRSIFTDAYATFIETLTNARVAAGITQADLAARLGKPQSFVSKVETGARRLDVIEFCAVARAIGREPEELLSALSRKLPVRIEI